MRGSLASARGLVVSLCLTWVASTPSGCTRTWELSNQSGGGAPGAAATSGASGADAGAGGSTGGGAGIGAGGGGLGSRGEGGRGRGSAGAFGELGGQGGMGLGPPSGSGGRFGSGCPPLSWSSSQADVIFVVGHNQSMGTAFGDTTSRAAGVTTAIQSVLGAYSFAVNFGYQEFPSRSGCTGSPNVCCVSDQAWVRAGNLNMYPLWPTCDGNQSSSCLSPTDGRPIAQTLAKTQSLFASSDGGPSQPKRYVVLITDGPPGCGDETDACNTAVTAVSDLARSTKGPVPVLTLGDDAANNSCLRMMITAGGYVPPAPTMPAKDTNSLTMSLEQIVSKAAAGYCTIKLSAPVAAPGSSVEIRANGHLIAAHDVNNGWEFSPHDQTQWIQVNGQGCRDLQNSPLDRIDVDLCPAPGGP